jgi:hypothetical protein
MIRIFIGYDPRESAAYHVFAHSIMARATRPVTIAPLMLTQLSQVYTRPRHALQSTDFSFTRFLVPYLCGYEGWAAFFDCDMLMLDDVSRLWDLRDDASAVQVVKHSHVPAEKVKFLGATQTKYEKKNWSSAILFNNARCRALTPDYVNSATGLELHQFKWLAGDHMIGEIPHRWNHLVDYDPNVPASEVSNLHYTIGGPYFEQFRDCGYADLWRAERDRMLACQARDAALPRAG